MAVEAIKGAGMTYQGSTSTAELKSEAKPKIEASEQIEVSEQLARSTSAIDTKATGEGDSGAQNQSQQDAAVENSKEQIKKAIEEINKKANNSEAIFGIHEATNRVTIKLVDKETKEVIKELPPEKTLDMIAKIWEMAGILVDEKR